MFLITKTPVTQHSTYCRFIAKQYFINNIPLSDNTSEGSERGAKSGKQTFLRSLDTMIGAVVVALLLAALGTDSEQALAVTCPVSEPALISHQFECSLAFLCNQNETTPALLLRCPDGMQYNQPSPSRCELPQGTSCTPLITTEKLSSSGSPPACPDSALSYVYLLQNTANCSQFFRCYQGEAKLFECPSYWYFDPVYEVCKPAKKPQCPSTNDKLVYLPHPTNCNAFYECSWGNAVLFYCPQGLFFNYINKGCDYPQNVDCNRCHL